MLRQNTVAATQELTKLITMPRIGGNGYRIKNRCATVVRIDENFSLITNQRK